MKIPTRHLTNHHTKSAGDYFTRGKALVKCRQWPRALRWLILSCFVLCAGKASAHHSPATHLSGTVEGIDREKHLLAVKLHEHGELLLLQWGRWTTFVKDAEIVSASALNPGHAEIYYRVPFFGKPTLEKIVWQGNPKTRAH